MNVLVTGSRGLIGSEAVEHFDAVRHTVFGLDNDHWRAPARRTLQACREAVVV